MRKARLTLLKQDRRDFVTRRARVSIVRSLRAAVLTRMPAAVYFGCELADTSWTSTSAERRKSHRGHRVNTSCCDEARLFDGEDVGAPAFTYTPQDHHKKEMLMTVSLRQLTGAVVVSFCVGAFIAPVWTQVQGGLNRHRRRPQLQSSPPT